MIELKLVSRTNPLYKGIRDQHYVENHGCIGRQLHYLVYQDDVLVGIISGASAVWACKPRDDFFGVTKENRIEKIADIVNNVVFRLEIRQPNLGTQVLSKWRKQIKVDWKAKYGSDISGFETFIFGDNRNGAMYKADNWIYVGETQGSAKHKPHGAYNKGERLVVPQKLIFCKTI